MKNSILAIWLICLFCFACNKEDVNPIKEECKNMPVSDSLDFSFINRTNSVVQVTLFGYSLNRVLATPAYFAENNLATGNRNNLGPGQIAVATNGNVIVNNNSSTNYSLYGPQNNLISTVAGDNSQTCIIYNPFSNYFFSIETFSGFNGMRIINANDGSLVAQVIANVALFTGTWIALNSLNGNVLMVNNDGLAYLFSSNGSPLTPGGIAIGTNSLQASFNSVSGNFIVSNFDSNNLTIINGTTGAVVSTLAVGSNPYSSCENPTNGNTYVAIRGQNTVAVVNSSGSVIKTIPVGSTPNYVAYNAILNQIYVANVGSNDVSIINADNNEIARVSLNDTPNVFAFDEVGNTIVSTASGNTFIDKFLNIQNTAAGTNFQAPFGDIIFNPVNDKMYVVSGNGVSSNSLSILNKSLDIDLSIPGTDPTPIFLEMVNNPIKVTDIQIFTDTVSQLTQSMTYGKQSMSGAVENKVINFADYSSADNKSLVLNIDKTQLGDMKLDGTKFLQVNIAPQASFFIKFKYDQYQPGAPTCTEKNLVLIKEILKDTLK